MLRLTICVVIFASAIGVTYGAAGGPVGNPLACPVVRVACDDVIIPGQKTCTALISKADPSLKPSFHWEVSDQVTIISGQGTSALTVDWTGPGYFLAAVKVTGFPPECASSGEYRLIADPGPRKVAEYSDAPAEAVTSHLDRLAGELRKEPHAQGYILSYAGRVAQAGEAQQRGERAKRYLMRKGGFDPRMIVVVDGGYRETHAIELYVVPSGVTPPQITPTLDPSEVKITRRKRKPRMKS